MVPAPFPSNPTLFHCSSHSTITSATWLWAVRPSPRQGALGTSARPRYSVQLLSRVQFFATPWTTTRQASLSITNSQNLLKLMSIESVISSNHLILCRPLLLLHSVSPGIRVFSNESVLHIGWPKYWSFSFNISPLNEYSD